MKTRIISAIFMLPLLALLYFGGIWLEIAVIIGSAIGLNEFYGGFKAAGIRPSYAIGYGSLAALYILYTISEGDILMPWLILVLSACMIYGFDTENIELGDITATLYGIVYIVFFFHFLVRIDASETANMYLWLVFIISFGTDIFAYFSGMLLGKHKLCPKLSPKKTIEGALGGLAGALVFSILFESFVIKSGNALSFHFIAMTLIGSAVSQVGDLSASSFKRRMGIKDYGKLIPGHGGILDRFDSVLFVAPYVYIYITYILPQFAG